MINSFAIIAERVLLKLNKYHKCSAPQLFILGLPRSGTTLIYQYIVHRLNVAYFTHGVGKYPCAPCVVTFVQNKLFGRYQSDFKSSYGKMSGPVSPREAGGFWIRFFAINNYVTFDDQSEKDIDLLRNTIACIQKIFGEAPFVNKNVKHLLRIEALGEIFPNSKFLIVERNISDGAISLLRGRYDNLSDPKEWFSVRPPNYETLKNLSIVNQIANQSIYLKQKIEKDLANIQSKRVIRIHYEDFCTNPEELIHNVKFAINATETRNHIQRRFKISHNYPQNQEESDLINLVGNFRNE